MNIIKYDCEKMKKSNLRQAPRLPEEEFKKGYTRIRRRDTVKIIKDRRLYTY